MSYALVGSLGAPVQSTSGGAISGLAYGQTPTAGNLLVIWFCSEGATTLPTTPGGWTNVGAKGGTTMVVNAYTKIAAGSDSVPTFAGITSSVQTVMLGEFSGNTNSAAKDQSGNSSFPLTSPLTTGSFNSTDAQSGELVVYSSGIFHSAAVTDSMVATINGSLGGNDVTNNGTSTVSHYDFGYAVTMGNSSPDSVSIAFNGTSVTGVAVTAFSFPLPPVPVFSVSDPARTRIPGIH